MTIDFRRHAKFPLDAIRKQLVVTIRNCDDSFAIWLEDTLQFLEKGLVLLEMFQHIDGDHAIELAVGDWKRMLFKSMDGFVEQFGDLVVIFARNIRLHPFAAVLAEVPVE